MNGEGAPKGALKPRPARQLEQTKFSRLEIELGPRLAALTSNLAAVTVGLLDFDEVGVWITKLAMRAESELKLALAEDELRRAS